MLSTVGTLFSGGAQFVFSVLVGQVFGPATLGFVRASLSLANTASLLWPSAAGQSASLFVARERSSGDAAAAAGVARHLAGRTALAVGLLAPAAAGVAHLVFAVAAIDAVWVALLMAALGAYQLARGVRFGEGEVLRATAWEFVNAAVSLSLLAVVLGLGGDGWLLAPLVAGNTLYALTVWVRIVHASAPLTAGFRQELDRFVVWGVAGTIASTGLLQLSMVLAKVMAGDLDAGLYAAAISLATPLSMGARALSMALFPEMGRQRGRDDQAALVRTVDRATRGLAASMVPAFTTLVLMAESLVQLVYGAEFIGAVGPLRILLLAVLVTTVPVAAVNSINVRGSSGVRRSAVFSWVGLAAGLVGVVFLGSTFGILGVAAGYLVGVAVTGVLVHAWVWRRDGHRWMTLTLFTVMVPCAALVIASTAQGWLPRVALAGLAWAWGAWQMVPKRSPGGN